MNGTMIIRCPTLPDDVEEDLDNLLAASVSARLWHHGDEYLAITREIADAPPLATVIEDAVDAADLCCPVDVYWRAEEAAAACGDWRAVIEAAKANDAAERRGLEID